MEQREGGETAERMEAMVVRNALEMERHAATDEESRLATKVFLGSYMPFMGVSFYTLLDERDVAEHRNRLGPTGWRLHRAQICGVSTPAPTSTGEAVALLPQSHMAKLTLKDAEVFKALSEEQIERVARLSRRLHAPARYVLGRAGEPGNRLFVIVAGKAELSAHCGIGEVTVRIAGPGESFPLAALIGSGELITSAEAVTDMELLEIPRASLKALCSERPDIGIKLYAAIAETLSNRYAKALAELTSGVERALSSADFWANIF
jgi:CRP-like cAMP-binding protein